MDQDAKSRFLKVYSDLPEKVRQEIIAVVDEKPYTWNASFVEIKTETDLGEKILNKLKTFEII